MTTSSNRQFEQSDKPKFFGRRKGRTIRKAKSFLLEDFLPRLLLNASEKIDLNKNFNSPKQRYAMEIGFGDGSHLAAIAKSQPETGFVGVEVYKNGVANLLSLITGVKEGNEADLAREVSLEPGRADNIRIFDDDVRLLFSALPDACFDKIYLLFPDPWPKKKHEGRRFVNPDNLRELARLLKKSGILQIATDHAVYKGWVLHTLAKDKNFLWTAKCSDDWRQPPADWFETKYQCKAVREGRKPVFFEYQRI